jgi:hypothetical protein
MALIDQVSRGDDFSPMVELVRESGQVATTMGAADEDVLAARTVRATNVRGDPTPERLNWLAQQVAAGKLRIEVQATYPPVSASTGTEPMSSTPTTSQAATATLSDRTIQRIPEPPAGPP